MQNKADELFDVVDENDQVIGQEKRGIVHARNLHHRAVHILIFNAAGEVFLQKRSPWKDLHPNVWDSSCSGHVDSGEDYDPAAAREIGEELGLIPSPKLTRLFKLSTRPETGWEFVWVYEGRSEGPFALDPDEISDGKFFIPVEVDQWIEKSPRDFAPAFVFLWKKYRSPDFKFPMQDPC
jgi:isopentenyldiphosphate isomerase